MLSRGCFYVSIGARAFGVTQLIPLIVSGIMFALNAYTGDDLFFWLGLFMYLPNYMVWAFQRFFLYIRPDPVCQAYQTLAFPTFESMYIGGIIGLFFIWTIVHIREQSWFVWLVIYLIGIVFPVVLVYSNYNVWWEVFFSMCFGFISAVFFVYIYDWFIYPLRPYLMNHFPLWHFGYRPKTTEENLEFQNIEEVLRKMDEE